MKKIVLILTLLAVVLPASAQTKKARRSQKSSVQKQSVQKAATQNKTMPSRQNEIKDIDMGSQFDSLGTQQDVVDKAMALQPDNSMRVVQKREVDRNWRLEFGGSYGFVNGGDSYVDTRNWGANVDLHITPRWSFGLRYIDSKNELTAEGKRVFDAQAGSGSGTVPDIDFPINTYLAVVNWYPIYGKVSWLESAITQFDFYLLAGGGTVRLDSGSSAAFTGGVGMGIWWNSWLTSRIEVRYQNHKDKIYNGERSVDSIIANFGIGFLL
ncbi:MAG: outer membrane beta-barrel domain-containing protein [Bdellovibrionales bacterium]|nr:outer membrane beta-barrel domain-containing protein [Bdellovibrionales bacterium]